MAALQAAFADSCDPYWRTICPWLLPSNRVPVNPLLELYIQPRRLRTPSPTPTMSSEDDPQPTATVAGGAAPSTAVNDSAANSQSLPPPPPSMDKTADKKDADVPPTPATKGSTISTDSDNSAAGKSSNFWQSSVLSAEPQSTENLHSQPSSTNGSQISLRPSRWHKARSTSTESGLSLSGMTTLGSMYNAEGFPNYPISSDEDKDVQQLAVDDAAIAKQIALTDEAVRSINGTSSVFQARTMNNMMPAPQSGNTYELPRSMAAFVRRGDGTERELPTGRSFVSSGSSTSSEESEHLASVQWVEQVSRPSPSSYQTFNPSYFYGNNGSSASAANQPPNPKMPPPSSTGRTPMSPRNRNGAPNSAGSHNSGGGFQRLPSTGAASSGAPNSANTPGRGASGEGSVENDDDDQTVGFNREGSPSSSSASGLDLLSHAAAHHERSRSHSHTKRKAGAEAVAQWRESGIPSGASRINDIRAGSGGYDSPGYESTPSDGQQETREPPAKRRKSEVEPPDARLAQTSIVSPEEGDSDFNTEVSASDSEYQGGSKAKGRPTAKTGKAKRTAGHRVRPTLPAPAGSSSPAPPAKAQPKKGRKSSPAPAAGGVQCEYINPLPPYQRCTDMFTRKYDIPRHMARHARREGDLVAEGRLEERKALLWLSIKDKPSEYTVTFVRVLTDVSQKSSVPSVTSHSRETTHSRGTARSRGMRCLVKSRLAERTEAPSGSAPRHTVSPGRRFYKS